MERISYALIIVVLLGCHSQVNEIVIGEPIQLAMGTPADGAYFTTDHQHNVVLCYTAGNVGEKFLYYVTYNDDENKFGEPVCVVPSKGTEMSSESMNKVAFRKDGTVVAVWAMKHPTEENKYAGSIFYAQSFDGGSSWSRPAYLHTDTLEIFSRSYFDIATLADGEVGAIWLDGRLQRGDEGTSLFFSKTKERLGFQSDKLIGETVCQCCRTTLVADVQGNVHIAYRDIESSIKGQIRDFVYCKSADNGTTFSMPVKISEDNWVIEGCPHTGAAMALVQNTIAVAWFTAGGHPGMYYTTTTGGQRQSFYPRQLIAEGARHPQMTIARDNTFIVWDEPTQTQTHDHMAAAKPVGNIVLRMLNKDQTKSSITKIVDDKGGSFPVITTVNKEKLLIAYMQQNEIIVRVVMLR